MEHSFDEMQKFIEQRVTAAKKVIRSGLQLPLECSFFIYYPGSMTYSHIEIPYVTDHFLPGMDHRFLLRHIDRAYRLMRDTFENDNVKFELVAVVLLNEGWYVRISHDLFTSGQSLPMPSQQPDRKEALICIVHQKIERFMYYYVFNRAGRQLIFETERQGGPTPPDDRDARFNFDNIWPTSA